MRLSRSRASSFSWRTVPSALRSVSAEIAAQEANGGGGPSLAAHRIAGPDMRDDADRQAVDAQGTAPVLDVAVRDGIVAVLRRGELKVRVPAVVAVVLHEQVAAAV